MLIGLGVIVLPFLIAGLAVCARYWRAAVPAVLVWALFEGAARKWGLPQFQSAIYLIKDGVVAGAFLGFLLEYRKIDVWRYISPAWLAVMALLIGYLVLLLLNPRSPSTLLALVGLKNHLAYVPMAIMVPAIIEREEQLYRFLRLFLFFTIMLGLLGLYQFTQPTGSWVNVQISGDGSTKDAVARFGAGEGMGEFRYGRVRTSATFSYIGGFITYLILAVPMISALVLSDRLNRRDQLIAYAAIAVGLGASFTTGARSAVFIILGGVPLILAVGVFRGLLSFQLFLRIVGAGVLLLGIVGLLYADAISALLFRAQTADSTSARLLSPLIELEGAFRVSPIFGTGLGTNSNAAVSIMNSPYQWWLDGYNFELETGRVLQETGFLGFALTYVLRFMAVFLAIRYAVRHTNRFYVALCLGALVFLIAHLFLFVVNNPLAGIFYYALIGMIFATAKLATKDAAQGVAESPVPPARFAVPAGR